jgi:hypothetical protein
MDEQEGKARPSLFAKAARKGSKASATRRRPTALSGSPARHTTTADDRGRSVTAFGNDEATCGGYSGYDVVA